MPPQRSSLHGFDRLQERLPDLQSPSGYVRVLGLPILLFFLISTFFGIEDLLGGVWWLDGEVVILTTGFLSLSLFFRLKNQLKERYGKAAYPLAFKRFVAPGLAVLFAVILRLRFIPGPVIPQLWWYPVLPALGWALLIIGILLWLRAVQALGVDTLTMSYVYFPEEGELAQHSIYGILRHPIYGAAQRIAYGLSLLNGSWFALTLAFIFSLEMWGWVRLVEEKELIERFGLSYAEYRNHVPAFWPRLKDLGGFYKFLLTGR